MSIPNYINKYFTAARIAATAIPATSSTTAASADAATATTEEAATTTATAVCSGAAAEARWICSSGNILHIFSWVEGK